MTGQYDLIAIGAGSGGLSVAERAARYGARCAIVESGKLGGTCVNLGCVPKKVMWYAASIAHTLEEAGGYGYRIAENSLDWFHLKQARDDYVNGINDWYHTYLADSSIDEISGLAIFASFQAASSGLGFSAAIVLEGLKRFRYSSTTFRGRKPSPDNS